MISPETFIRTFILPHENAYAAGHWGDPAYVITERVQGDPGGATRYGIDQASHPEIDVDTLTEDQAVAIYLKEYNAIRWSIPMSVPALPNFPGPSGLVFFDCRENLGLNAAWKCAQNALGIKDDGIPGVLTESAVMKASGLALAMGQIDCRIGYYRRLVASNPSMQKFLDGWLNRCNDLKQFQFFSDVAS